MSITKTYNFKITGDDEKKCLEAASAANDIVKAIPHADLLYLANVAKKEPNFVTKAKPYMKIVGIKI